MTLSKCATMKTLMQVLILATLSYLNKGQCPLVYTTQPPTTLECSPYDNSLVDNHNQEFRLRIACAAEKVKNSGFDNFDLFWHRRQSSDGLVENLGTGTESMGTSAFKRIIMAGIPGLSLAPFSEEMPGDYWCQAVISNSSGQYLLTESNVLTVLRPENYTGLSVCGTAKFENVETCANITQSSSLVSPLMPSLLPSLSLPTLSFTPTKGMIPFTPSTSTSIVSEESSTDSIILVLVGVLTLLLILLLLLVAGIVITLIFRQKAKLKAEPATLTGPLQEEVKDKCSEITNLEGYGSFSLQPAEYELPVSLGLSLHPQTTTTTSTHHIHSSQTLNNKVYESKEEHPPILQEGSLERSTHPNKYDTTTNPEMFSALSSSNDPAYSHLQHVQTSSNVSIGRDKSQYSELSHKKEVNHASHNQVLLSESPEQKSKSCIFDDHQYAVPCPSGPPHQYAVPRSSGPPH